VGVWHYAPTLRSPSQTLGAIVRGFKGAATARVNALRRTPGSPVWQRNYYDRVIRDDEELMRIREYIKENPANWARDDYNPSSW
jgi:REP element-mobilizing transposase RayT